MKIIKYKLESGKGVSYQVFGLEGRKIINNKIMLSRDNKNELFIGKKIIKPVYDANIVRYAFNSPAPVFFVQFTTGDMIMECKKDKNEFIIDSDKYLIVNPKTYCEINPLKNKGKNIGPNKDYIILNIGSQHFQDIFDEMKVKLNADNLVFTQPFRRKTKEFSEFVNKIFKVSESDIFGKEIMIQTLIYQFILYLLNGYSHNYSKLLSEYKKTEVNEPRVEKAMDFIKDNYYVEFSLDELSKACAISKNHLLRLFKTNVGKSPWQYLNTYRIEKAKTLLKSKRHTISQICAEIGFNDLRHFERMFKAFTGLTPSEYKKNLQ